MAIITWNDPLNSLTNLRPDLDDLFGLFPTANQDHIPAMDIYSQGDKQLVVEVHLPGFTLNDLEITAEDDYLEIQGKLQTSQEEDGERTYMLRQSVESFYRRIALPKHADTNNISASFEDGTLKIVVPYISKRNSKKIAVKPKNQTRKSTKSS